MVKEVIVAQEGFEEDFEYINGKIANIEADKEAEIAKAVVEVEARFAVKLEKYKALLGEISAVAEVEVPDEPAEEVAEEVVEG